MALQNGFSGVRWTIVVATVLGLLVACGGSNEDDVGSRSLSGQIRYADRVYSVSGFSGAVSLKPVRHAEVELLDGAGVILASTTTDADGRYAFTDVSTRLRGLRVLSSADPSLDPAPVVQDHSGAIYAATDAIESTVSPLLHDVDIVDTDGVAGAFNIYDVMVSASLYVGAFSSTAIGPVRAFWNAGSSRYGTYTCSGRDAGSQCPQGRGIYLLGGQGGGADTDEYDDDVILHEFGHALEFGLDIHDSPGGLHLFTDQDLDLRLAWSEGLGHFLTVAVKAWLALNDPQRLSISDLADTSQYVDTVGDTAFAFDLEQPDPGGCGSVDDCYRYASNEVAVVKSVSSLRRSYGDLAIWSVIGTWLPAAQAGARQSSIETFWDGWLALGLGSAQADAATLAEREVRYLEDAAELVGDDTPLAIAGAPIDCGSGACLSTEVRTLYKDSGAGDRDFFALRVEAGHRYTIETNSLRNGADTELRLYEDVAASAPVLSNDNLQAISCASASGEREGTANTTDNYASRLVYDPDQNGVVFVEVRVSPSLCAGAGRYGSYRLHVDAAPAASVAGFSAR